MTNFDDKQKELLSMLQNANSPILLGQLQKALNTSRRTIYYLVNKINDVFIEHDLIPIYNKRGQGYYLDEQQKEKVVSLLYEDEDVCFLKPQQRVQYLICWMLYPSEVIHVETIMSQFEISRNSVFNDLKSLKEELKNFDIKLEIHAKHGYRLQGQSFSKRTILLYYLRLLLQKVHHRSIHFLNSKDVETFYERLIRISSEMGNEYNNENLISIASFLSVTRHVNEKFEFSLMELRDLGETDELRLIDDYFQDFNVHERLYLAVHLLGSKAGSTIKVSDDEHDIRLFELAQRLANVFERKACIQLVDKNELINSLYMHFKLSMYYCRLSIQTLNPLMKEVKDNYRPLYEMMKMICEDMKNDFPFPLSESEIVYITMHFGGHLRKGEGKFYRTIRVLVVCPSGISTSTLLKREIEDLYSNVNVVATAAASDIMEYEDDIDFIVSTITIESDIPWIKVNTILNQEDKSRIASLMMLNFETYKIEGEQIDGLFGILKKYVAPEQMDAMKKDVFAYLQQGNILVKVDEQDQFHIYDILKKDHILIHKNVSDWKTMIKEGSVPLLEKNYIRDKYVDAMISLIEDYGPYIVLQNKVAIAHADAKKGANMLGLSLLISEEAIAFDEEASVQFLFVLSNPDQEKHLQLLRDIMQLSSKPAILKKMLEAKDEEEVLSILREVFRTI